MSVVGKFFLLLRLNLNCVQKNSLMNHARILCRSNYAICDITLLANVSQIESKNLEKRLISCLTSACRDV